MEITCSQCNTKLVVPDEKIPKDQIARISCPKCKNRITLDTRNASQDKPSGEEYSYDDYSDDHALEFFDEGAKIALVMLKANDERQKIGNALEALGYRCVYAEDTRDALGKLRFHFFNMIFLSDGFDNQDIGNSPIMNYLNRVPISSRRKIFVALMGERFKTMDDMMAFAMSSNSVINTKDVDRLNPILKKGVSENDKFYKVLTDTLVEVGKD